MRTRAGLAIACVAALATVTAAAAAPGWTTYAHARFALQFPVDWSATAGSGSTLVIVLGPQSADPNVRMNVNVTAERVPAGVTVAEYSAAAETHLRRTLPQYRPLRTDTVQHRGHPAIIRYHTWVAGTGATLYQVQLLVVAGADAFVVTGTTSAASPRLREEAELLLAVLRTFVVR